MFKFLSFIKISTTFAGACNSGNHDLIEMVGAIS